MEATIQQGYDASEQLKQVWLIIPHLCQRHNRKEAEAETKGDIPVQVVGNSAQRHEDEEDIEPRIEEEVAIAGNPTRFTVSDDESPETLAKGELCARCLGVAGAVVAAGAVAGKETGMLCGGHTGRGRRE